MPIYLQKETGHAEGERRRGPFVLARFAVGLTRRVRRYSPAAVAEEAQAPAGTRPAQ